MSDLLIILDDVQYLRRGWHNRDKIKAKSGARWLTVPIKNKGKYRQDILDAEIDNERDWRVKHLNALKECYACAPFYGRCVEALDRDLLQGT